MVRRGKDLTSVPDKCPEGNPTETSAIALGADVPHSLSSPNRSEGGQYRNLTDRSLLAESAGVDRE